MPVPEFGSKVYLAGPMSGYPQFNYPLFDQIAHELRHIDYVVLSPAENNRALFPGVEQEPGFAEGKGEDHGSDRRYRIMHADLQSVLDCDWVAMLPGWERSVGSTIERRVAETVGKPIYLAEVVGCWVNVVFDQQQIRCDHSAYGDGWQAASDAPTLFDLDEAYDNRIAPSFGETFQQAVAEHNAERDALNERLTTGGALHHRYRGQSDLPEWMRGSDTTAVRADRGRTFDTGASRDSDEDKPDYEGFLSPLAIRRFGEYMTKHRVQSNGEIRPSDNWQHGFPLDVYMKSMWRHFHDVWMLHRGHSVEHSYEDNPDLGEALAALFFNVQGYLHELEKGTPCS